MFGKLYSQLQRNVIKITSYFSIVPIFGGCVLIFSIIISDAENTSTILPGSDLVGNSACKQTVFTSFTSAVITALIGARTRGAGGIRSYKQMECESGKFPKRTERLTEVPRVAISV